MKSALSLMFLMAATPAFAQSTTTSPTNDEATRIANELGLDASTVAAVAQTFAKYGAELDPIMQTEQETRQALAQELAAAQPDATRLTQLANQLTGAHQQVESIAAQRMTELQQELTPAQFAKMLLVQRHGGGHRPGGPLPSSPTTAPQQ